MHSSYKQFLGLDVLLKSDEKVLTTQFSNKDIQYWFMLIGVLSGAKLFFMPTQL